MKIRYLNKIAKVIKENDTHYVLEFENGSRLTILKSTVEEKDKITQE